MNMKNLKMVKKVGSLALMLAMVLVMSAKALPAYAAGGTISIKYDPAVDLKEPTNFELYKVGTFGHDSEGMTTIDLDSMVAASGVNLNIEVPDTEEEKAEGSEWHKDWLSAASDLANWIKTPAEGKKTPDPIWTGQLSKSPEYQQINGNFENGVYLLIGDEQRVGDQYWAPVPVLIMVLDGDTYFEISNIDLKMQTRGVVHEHTVTKTWQDAGYEDNRPESVTIGIYYGGNQVDTVVLSDANNWTYTWYSTESAEMTYSSKDPDTGVGVTTAKLNSGNDYTIPLKGSGVWTVAELDLPSGYTWSLSGPEQSDDSEKFILTNTLLPPVTDNPPVEKIVNGDGADPDDTFKFKFEAVSNTAGVENPMPPGSTGNVKIIETTADVLREFGDIVFRVPGEYYYRISEINTGLDGYTYDTSVYQLHYTITLEDGKLVSNLEVTKNGEPYENAVYIFENDYDEEVPPPPGTGDYTNIVLPVVVFIGAMIAFAVILMKRRQKKDNK